MSNLSNLQYAIGVIVISLLIVAFVPLGEVIVIEKYNETRQIEVEVPYEVQVPYLEEVPYLGTGTNSIVLMNYSLYYNMESGQMNWYYFDIASDENVTFFVNTTQYWYENYQHKFTSYVFGSVDFDFFLDGVGANYELAKNFISNGTLKFNCTSDDTYYFVWKNQDDESVSLEHLIITKFWKEEMTLYRNETRYNTEIEYKTEIHNQTETKQRNIIKKVTLLQKIFGNY